MMRALLMGYYGGRNLGDEMMLVCLLRWLAEQNVDVTVLTENAAEISAIHGLSAVENVPLLGQWAWRDAWFRGKAFRVLKALASHDALIIGGGDLIRDDRGWRPFFFSIEKMVAAFLLGKPVSLVNIGIGTPQTRYGRLLLRAMLPRCARIVVRDRRSFEVCRRFGAADVTDHASDIAMTLPNVLPSNRSAPARPYALVCLRGDSNAFGRYPMTEPRVRNLAAGCDSFVERCDLDIVFLPFQSMGKERDDNQLHERVVNAMTHRDRATIRPWTRDLAEVVDMVRGASCVVAMRLHAAVLAAVFKRSCVLMPYDEKVANFAQQARLRHSLTPEILDRFDDTRRVLHAALADGPCATGSDPLASWNTLTVGVPKHSGPTPVAVS